MNERDTMSILQSDIVIPEIVQEKANMAFQKIRETNTIDTKEQKIIIRTIKQKTGENHI